ncbi:MAG: porin [Roseovarius sp.]
MTHVMLGCMEKRYNPLTTLAIVGASLCAPAASAQEFHLGVGAVYDQFFGYVDYDAATASDFAGADAVAAGQVFLVPSFTTDSGLRFGADVEIEAHLGERNAGVIVDEAAFFLRGGFGELRLGRSDSPGNHMQFGAPVGYGPELNFSGISSASLPSLLQYSDIHSNVGVGDDLLRGTLGSTYEANTGSDTTTRISYYSPRVSGFQLGLSYASDGSNSSPNREEFFDISANYTRQIGTVDLGVSAKYGVAGNSVLPGDAPEYWGLGLELGYGNLTVGGSYAQSTGSALGVTDGEAYDLGATYQAGRYGFSVQYLSGQNTDDENAALGGQEQLQALTLSASYALFGDLAPDAPPRPGADPDARYTGQDGISGSIFGFVSMSEFTEDLGDAGAGTPGDDTEGFVVGTGFRLTF